MCRDGQSKPGCPSSQPVQIMLVELSDYPAKKVRELSKATHTAIAFSFVGGAAFSILGIIAAPFLLRRMEVPENIFSMTLSYVRIYYGGFIFSIVYINITKGHFV